MNHSLKSFDYAADSDGIVTVTMDMSGPVNAINEEFVAALEEAVTRLESEAGLAGVVIASAKQTFIAGGDLKDMAMVDARYAQELTDFSHRTKAVMRRLEKLPVPVVAALNGAALGGGYELALCCNHRIAWDDRTVLIGFPEVTLGLLPGGGGTVRLTKLLGFEKALPLLLEATRLSVDEALDAGLIHGKVATREELVPAAKDWILRQRGEPDTALQPWDRRGYTVPGGDLSNPQVRGQVHLAPFALRKKTRGLLPAPERILDTVVEALKLDLDTALRVETRNFVSLLISPQAKNMISAYFFQMNEVRRNAARPQGVKPCKVRKLGVVGAGMMGQGISCAAALAGIDVVLSDVSTELAEQGKAYTAAALDRDIADGKRKVSDKAQVLGRILATAQADELGGCDLIIEAVPERFELKQQVLAQVQSSLAPGGILGSNTSTLPISRLATANADPARFIGIHFFSPAERMGLVELVCGDRTSDETLARALDFVRQLRKTPIVVKDEVGFFTARTIGAQLLEAAELVAEGVHPARIETLAREIGLPVGPLALHDEIGECTSIDAQETQEALGLRTDEYDDPTPLGTELLLNLVKEHGRGGRRHGGGYYDYDGEGKQLWPRLLELYYRPDLAISDEDIKDRLLFSSVIESLKCLEQGVLRSVADGNIGSLLGIGAPTWTGGYIQFVNTYGLQRFIDRCEELAGRYDERFRAPAIVTQKLAAGELFS